MGKSTFENMEVVEGLEKIKCNIIIVVEVIIINRITTFIQNICYFLKQQQIFNDS